MTADQAPEPKQKTFSHHSGAAGEQLPRAARPGRRPTMKDVAALADVAVATVSRVVNGQQVRADLTARVHKAVELLGYRHDHTASSLRRSDRLSATLGLIVEDVTNPFFSAVHRGIEEVARQRGVFTYAASSDAQADRERELAQSLAARRVDGLIVAPAAVDHSYLQRERAAGIALVFVDRPARFLDTDVVLTDNAGGVDAAISHLIAHGHRRIAILRRGDRPDLHTANERLHGYRNALARHGIPEDPALIRSAHERPGDVLRQVLQTPDPPTAVFTSQNLITVEVVRAIHELGLQRTLGHVGFDDVALADGGEPGLTVIAQDPVATGRSAAELLFSRIDGHDGPSRRVVHPTTLIPRGSGELPGPAGPRP